MKKIFGIFTIVAILVATAMPAMATEHHTMRVAEFEGTLSYVGKVTSMDTRIIEKVTHSHPAEDTPIIPDLTETFTEVVFRVTSKDGRLYSARIVNDAEYDASAVLTLVGEAFTSGAFIRVTKAYSHDSELEAKIRDVSKYYHGEFARLKERHERILEFLKKLVAEGRITKERYEYYVKKVTKCYQASLTDLTAKYRAELEPLLEERDKTARLIGVRIHRDEIMPKAIEPQL